MPGTTDRTPEDRIVPVFEALPPATLVETANTDRTRSALEFLVSVDDVKRVGAAENQPRARPGALRLYQERAKQLGQSSN